MAPAWLSRRPPCSSTG